MSTSEMFAGRQGHLGAKFVRAGAAAPSLKSLEYFFATGLGSRGGPNKASNKLQRNPAAYLSRGAAMQEYCLATGLRSRGGPNKASNKLKRCPGSYLFN